MESKIKVALYANEVKAVQDREEPELLESLGIGVSQSVAEDLAAMDGLPNALTTTNAGTPVQLLQFWDPVPVRIVTAPRMSDEVMGRTIAGSWEDEQVVVKVVERKGQASHFGDSQNVPLTKYNTEFLTRTVARFESGFQVNHLEEKRAARMQISADAEYRTGSAEALAIANNNVAFRGWNDGAGRTYGYLNDPNLPAYETAPVAIENATFIEIVNLFQNAIGKVVSQTQGTFNPKRDSFKISLPPSKLVYLTTPTQYFGGISVEDWLKTNYPRATIVYAPQLNGANGGADVMYVHADSLADQQVLTQFVQSTLYFVGFERKPKGQVEDYSSATAGFILKIPVGVARFTGV